MKKSYKNDNFKISAPTWNNNILKKHAEKAGNPSIRIYVNKLSFAKNMGKTIGENISKKLNGKYGQRFRDHAKQSATDELKTSPKRVFKN